MKKIVLISVLCGLFACPAFATHYKTKSYNCNQNAMMHQLDNATAEHRAVITEVECDAPMMNGGDYFEYTQTTEMEQVTTSETFVRKAKRPAPKPEYKVVEKRYSTIIVEDDCDDDCCDCDECCDECDDEVVMKPTEIVKPIVVPAKPVVKTVAKPVVLDNQGDLEEIEQCEKYGRCAS